MKKMVCAQMRAEDLARIKAIGKAIGVEGNISVVVRAAIQLTYNSVTTDKLKKAAEKESGLVL